MESRSEDKVDQLDKEVSEAEGNSLTLKCKYETDSVQENLFWYIQRTNEMPKYILRRSKFGGENGTEFQERFQSELSSNSVPLRIQDVRVSDSAVYYCALRPTETKPKTDPLQEHRQRHSMRTNSKTHSVRSRAAVYGNVVKPSQTEVFAVEGSSVTLSCSFTSSGGSDYLYWYRQHGKSRPKYLVLTYRAATKAVRSDVDPRFTVNIPKKEHVDLLLSTAALSDSAVYYCALQPTMKGNPSSLHNIPFQAQRQKNY
ncbi:hypothetical protein DNTS_029948 [Danionella cerebrum]|uniref:Ig-like domain-containing protein n=1 Tax=Danionella cerebrum TaxID=2873325 RepID=A0A553RQ02_9TELE|nr:hypothetical protein DNTS_029948 [Danionella translucida]